MLTFSSLVKIAFAAFAICFGTLLDAGCREKRAFDQVRIQTQIIFANGAPLTNSQRRELSNALKPLITGSFDLLLTQHNLSSHKQFLNDLMYELYTLQHTGYLGASVLTQKDMTQASLIFNKMCDTRQRIDAPKQISRSRRLLDQITTSVTQAFTSRSGPSNRSLTMLSFIFVFAVSVISGIILSWKAYTYTFSLIANRKKCKIPAVLKLPGFEASGYITILGTLGSRFVPDTAAGTDQLVRYLQGQSSLPTSALDVKGSGFGVKLHFIAKTHCVALFEKRLDRQTLNRLHGLSIVPAQFVPKNIVLSNLREINPKFA